MKNAIKAPEFEKRPYQSKGRERMRRFFSKWIRQELEEKPNKELTTAMLINMATWSWKTFTVGSFLNDLYELRERFYKLYPSKEWLTINALVFNDRINLVNQLRQDFIEGRKANNKPPIFKPEFIKNIETKTYHSKADELFEIMDMDEDQIEEYMEQEHDVGKVTVKTSNKKRRNQYKDSFSFATFQTALEWLDNVDPFNIIIVDEWHVLTGSKYFESFLKYYQPLPSGHYPLVIVMTATPTNKLRILTGKEIFKYGLAEYIMSPKCPKVNYNIVGMSKLTTQEKIEIYKTLDRIKNIRDAREKKRQLNEFEKYLQEALSKHITVKQLCYDFMNRVKNKDHTIIFTASIDEANEVVKELNKQAWDEEFAVALHSKAKRKWQDIIDDYNNGKHKVIVAVDMLNQGIDMPKTNNIVFWRHTDSALIFFQQLGRGLRGDEVNIYDYIGGIKNLVWINQVNDEIDDFVEMRRQKWEDMEKKKMDISVSHLTTKPIDNTNEEGGFDAVKIEYVDDDAKDDEEPYEINPMLSLPPIVDEELDLDDEDLSEEDMNEESDDADDDVGVSTLPDFSNVPEEKMPELIENWFSLQAIVGNMKEIGEEIKLTKEEIKTEFDKLGGYKKLMQYSQEQIANIDIKWYKILAISTAYWFRSKYNSYRQSQSFFQEFISKVYEKKFLGTKKSIKEEFDRLWGYDALMQYSSSQVKHLEISWKKMNAIAVICGFRSEYDLDPKNLAGFQEFLSYMYSKEFNPGITKEQIKEYFDLLGGYESLSQYAQTDIPSIKFEWKMLWWLATIYGFVSRYNLKIHTTTGLLEFLSFMYEKDFEYKPLDQKMIKEELDSLWGYNVLMKWKTRQIKKWEMFTHKVKSISLSYWFESKYSLNIVTPIGFQEFLSHVYNKPFIINEIKEDITKSHIKKHFDDLGWYEALIRYTQPQITALRIGWHWVIQIAKVYGFKSKYWASTKLTRWFQEFISAMYWHEFLGTKEAIRKQLDALWWYDILMKFGTPQIKWLEIGGNKLVALAGIYWFKSKHSLSLKSVDWFQEFISFIYQKPFSYEIITPEGIKKRFDNMWGYDQLMTFDTNQIKDVEIQRNKIIALANVYGFISSYQLDITTIKGFQEFIAFVYWKEFTYEEKTSLTKTIIKQELDKLGGYDTLMKYNQVEVTSLKINGHAITSVASQYWFKSGRGLLLTIVKGFQEFISHVYWKEFKYDYQKRQKLDKIIIKKELDKLGGYEKLIKYNSSNIRKITLKGNKILSIAKYYNFQSNYSLDVSLPAGFQEFISHVYWKEFAYEEKSSLTKTIIKQELDKLGGYDVLMKYTWSQLKKLAIYNNKITAIATAFGFNSQNNLNVESMNWFQEFISHVYWKEFSNWITKEEIKAYLDSLGWYDTLLTYTLDQIKWIEVSGKWVVALSSIYGFKSASNTRTSNVRGFQEFISFVYEKPYK